MRQVLAELTLGPQFRTMPDEHKQNRAHNQAQKAQQAARPRHAKLLIHRASSERQDRAKGAAGGARRSHGASGKDLVRVDEVAQQRYEQAQVTDAERDAVEGGHDPGDGRARRPAHLEE